MLSQRIVWVVNVVVFESQEFSFSVAAVFAETNSEGSADVSISIKACISFANYSIL